MGQGEVEVAIERSPDEVWKVVSDFGGIDAWLPGVESCRLEGDDRILGMMGMEITERLLERDDAARVLTYSVVGGAPVQKHQATIRVLPAGDGARATWSVEVEPDDLLAVFQSVYQQGLEALKKHVEG